MNSEILIYIIKRILLMIPTLLGVLTLTFAVVQFVPGGHVLCFLIACRFSAQWPRWRSSATQYAFRPVLQSGVCVVC